MNAQQRKAFRCRIVSIKLSIPCHKVRLAKMYELYQLRSRMTMLFTERTSTSDYREIPWTSTRQKPAKYRTLIMIWFERKQVSQYDTIQAKIISFDLFIYFSFLNIRQQTHNPSAGQAVSMMLEARSLIVDGYDYTTDEKTDLWFLLRRLRRIQGENMTICPFSFA